MKIENQVCTLEQAKKLKDIGISQVSQYHHFSLGFWSDGKGNYPEKFELAYHKTAPEGYIKAYSAFTSAELLAMISNTITINILQCAQPASALADHFIWLIETKELSIDECNDRLLNS